MARPKSILSLTIADLQNLLRAKKDEIPRLKKQRRRLAKELAVVDRELSQLSGRARVGRPKGSGLRGRRPKNAKSLVETIHMVLAGKGPMKVGDILDSVRRAGYKSKSANFRGIINQTLIKEKKFGSVGRGTYALRKNAA